MAKDKFTKEQVLEAVKDSATIISTVAKRLGCEWNTARKYIFKWNETRIAYENERQKTIDFAEGKLFEIMKKGDAPTIKWFLSKKAKDRNYGDEEFVEAGNDTKIEIIIDEGIANEN